MRKAAASLVEVRHQRFESRHDLATSRERMARALERARVETPWPFATAWSEADGRAILDVTYSPSPAAQWFLKLASTGFIALLAASAWAVMRAEAETTRFLVPMVTVLAVLGFPLVTLAMASSRAARESRVQRALRAALLDADEAYPPAKRWDDKER